MNNLNDLYLQVTSSNTVYNNNEQRWRFLLESYMGGDEYRQGGHLNRYQLETDTEYQNRLNTTPLDNHCRSVVNVYNSFMFRECPERNFGSLTQELTLPAFLEDADLEGRSLDAVMKEVSTWSSVFGSCWILLSKPNIGAVTRADEIALGVRPYISLITPLTVYDWTYERSITGHYTLTYFKYLEDVNDQITVVVEWYPDRIVRTTTNRKEEKVINQETTPNELGLIPVTIAYNQRSPVRGIGISDISDIADQQRAIYNELSEIEQAIRLDGHPSLVAPENTKIGSGAGSVIYLSETIDPGLKPYILDNGGSSHNSIWTSIQNRINSIDKMANTGAVRATESRTMSGVAMETEFQLLNARLSEKADNLELAEESMWQLWAMYQGYTWDGLIEYPSSFSIRDTSTEYQQLSEAKKAASTPEAMALIDLRVRQLLEDPRLSNEIEEPEEQAMYAVELAVLNNAGVQASEVIPPQPEEPESEA